MGNREYLHFPIKQCSSAVAIRAGITQDVTFPIDNSTSKQIKKGALNLP